ncbi:MAG: OmpA family protein [Polyangia bacterium]
MTTSKAGRSPSLWLLGVMAVGGLACAHAVPVELVTARTSYARASSGPAVQLLPADLHKAKLILDEAEASYVARDEGSKTADLAYIADRTIQIVEVQARTVLGAQALAKANQDNQEKQAESAKRTQAALVDTRKQLTDAKRGQAEQTQQVAVEHAARQDADIKAAASEQRALASDQKATEANDALAKLAAKDEERGRVITLSGNVLFRSNDAKLLPGAETRLDEVAVALIANGAPISIEGYTDSKGSQSRNLELSQQRAESVRTYLIGRGFPSEQVAATGKGADRPVADNSSAEGRANNRRVEIVVSKSHPKAN